MATHIVLDDFQGPPGTSYHWKSGTVLDDAQLPNGAATLAVLQGAGLAVLATTPGREAAAAVHRAYRASHAQARGAHLIALLAQAGEL